MLETKRYLGLELAGAKNQKTSLAAIEFYPRERKIFLLDIYDRIAVQENQSSDEALLELVSEMNPGITLMGVNVPLELPPCITCTRKCPMPAHCVVPAVKWMRDFSRKVTRHEGAKIERRARDFTPYTQRPIELWMRYQLFPQTFEESVFDIDETLGGNRAPLSARMNFLRRHLTAVPLVEVWPKLSVAILAESYGIQKRILMTYRQLEEGFLSREKILIELSKKSEIFIYERDLRKLAQNLTAFDAFICAFTALLSDQGLCAKAPKGFPEDSGWIEYPEI